MTVLTTPYDAPRLIRPFQINWAAALERRPRLLEIHDELPAYLLRPEVRDIIDAALDHHDNLLLDTLWHTGARIGEALQLTPKSFNLDGIENSDVILTTAKKRGRGRPKKGVVRPPKRLVPLADPVYLDKLQRYLATQKPKAGEPIFPYTDRHYRNRLKAIIDSMKTPPPIHVTPHTFRHSFAINLVYHGRDIRMIQKLLGHEHIEATLIYTNVLSGEMHHLMRDIEF